MIKPLIIIVISILLFSCEGTDKKFCACIKTSEEFNNLNKSILDGNTSLDSIKRANELLKEKKQLCSDYLKMTGYEMLKKKNACK
jgi:hypothetical protein